MNKEDAPFMNVSQGEIPLQVLNALTDLSARVAALQLAGECANSIFADMVETISDLNSRLKVIEKKVARLEADDSYN